MMMHESEAEDSEPKPLISDRMSKSRRSLRYFKVHHLFKPRFICLLTVSCVVSTIVFSMTFYLNIDHVLNLYYNPYLPTITTKIPFQQANRFFILSQNGFAPQSRYSIYDRNITYNDFNYLDSTTLTYERQTYANNISILFRLPEKRAMSGLLLIFHGCSRSAYEWFHTIERQRIIGAAIDLGYGCIAFQSTDRITRCWSSDMDISTNEDVQQVYQGLDEFYEKHPKLKSLPRFTFGASSGGIFSSIFAINKRYEIQGQILLISIILPHILETYVKEKSYPPTAWIYMSRDIEFASEERIHGSMKIFAQENIPHIGFDIKRISLTSSTFHERIPTITADASLYIFYRLQQNHWLDRENYLKSNPRRDEQWKTFLFIPANRKSEEETMKNLQDHEKTISEFLNTIYGEHEISFEHSFEALKWLKDVYSNNTNSTV